MTLNHAVNINFPYKIWFTSPLYNNIHIFKNEYTLLAVDLLDFKNIKPIIARRASLSKVCHAWTKSSIV